jgi:hypothetical protein
MQPMNVRVVLQLDNMPADTDLYTVGDVLRRQICEWLDFDSHPADVHFLTVEKADET